MIRVLRLTRHEATEEQVNTLAHKYGDVHVEMVSETLPTDPRQAVQRFDELANDFDIVEAVLPINLLESVLNRSEFCARGGRIIRAHMVRHQHQDGSATFAFSHYEWLKEVRIVTELL